MIHDPKTGPPDPELAGKLFRSVELEQGYAFISDGIGVLSAAEIVNLARGALKHTERTARILRTFLRTHDKGRL